MNAKTANAPQVFVILVDGAIDQMCGTLREARREQKDLIKMGCDNVRIKPFATWEDADKYETKLRGW